jgi:outer membrane protein OmpA-like peptidoglycan-associated protein
MRALSSLLAAGLGLAPLFAGGALAQNLTDAELRALFQNQIETFRAVRETPDLGASRGLVLAPVEGAEIEAVRVERAAPPLLAAPQAPDAATPGIELAAPRTEPASGKPAADPAGEKPVLDLAAPQMPEAATPEVAVAVPATTPAPTPAHYVLPEEQQVNLRVNFAFDSAAIAEAEKPKLRQLCSVMEETGVQLFRIIGHTDATGNAGYNQRLSVQRAEEVRQFFIDDCGIAGERLEAIGVGMQFPVNDSDPFAGENRRVEFQAMS